MTPYEEKCTQRSIDTLEVIVMQSKEKRDNLEKSLIKEARLSYNYKTGAHYADALMNSISVESSVIQYMEGQINDLKLQLKIMQNTKN